MSGQKPVTEYLPVSEATYYILLSLVEPLHGYAVMQEVERVSEGEVQVGPGTLYGAFSTLEKQDLIRKVSEKDRRKSYTLTPRGQQLLLAQLHRLEVMVRAGRARVRDLR